MSGDKIHYFDNAATSWPKPERVYEDMISSFKESGGNPGRGGHMLAMAAEQLVTESRHRVAKMLNAERLESIVFTLNATDALNIAIKGVLRPGDHAVTTTLEHNSVLRPLRGLEKRGEISLSVAGCGANTIVDPDAVLALIRPNTRLIVMTHASNVTGAIQPIDSVAKIAREHGILLLVDAAQTAGVVPLDVQAGGFDLVAAPGHKGLLGPTGTGVLYVRPGLELAPFREGGTGIKSEEPYQPLTMPHRLEAGTPNTLGIAGLGAGVGHLLEIGVERVLAHERMLASRFIERLRSISRVRVYGPEDINHRTGVVSLTLEGSEPADVASILEQSFHIAVRAGLHCAPGAHAALATLPRGTVRFSFGWFNTEAEIDLASEALAEIAAEG